MNKLNEQFNGKLTTAIEIFTNNYPKKFLHQLVSSQLDMDRLDYLKRDSFYSGVSEGIVGNDRIIKMLDVVNDELAVEEKGIYSIEKFIVARRLMYWQVYLHKTVVAGEFMLVKTLMRAKELANQNVDLYASPILKEFLYNHYDKEKFEKDPEILNKFSRLDDYDILGAIKVWTDHPDLILSELSKAIVHRNLLRIEISKIPFEQDYIDRIEKITAKEMNISADDVHYFVFNDSITNNAYNVEKDHINIKYKNGTVLDITDASDNFNIAALTKPVRKYFLCYPKFVHALR